MATHRPTVIKFICIRCKADWRSEYFATKSCPNCGYTGAELHISEISCRNCQYYMTSPMSSPAGSCSLDQSRTEYFAVCDNFRKYVGRPFFACTLPTYVLPKDPTE